jgi:hypothetical protein
MPDWIWWMAAAAGSAVAGLWVTWGFWHVAGRVRRRRAGPPPVQATRHRIWRDPGPPETLDLAVGPGGTDGHPMPPFTFLEEHAGGSSPCVSVRDARGHEWRVKWGKEVKSEPFACRIAWAAGYFVETNHFVPSGTIAGAGKLGKASSCIGADGVFESACFELNDGRARKLFDEHGWAWNDNPFVGTRELNGLKILVLLLSNWDNKDVRDVARGSNTAIFEYATPSGEIEARYLITDWGGSMGAWGGTVLSRMTWDCDAFAEQSSRFVEGVDEDGHVTWGYSGQRTADAALDIRAADVAWLHRRLGRLSDAQIGAALRACGADPRETDTFTRALRARLDQLSRVAALT